MRRILLSLLLSTALCGAASAQVAIQPSATKLDAATGVCALAGAVNSTQAAGTCTITPPSGLYVYFTFIKVKQCQDGTASISGIQLNFTSTNLNGWVRETSYLSAATITTNAGTNLCGEDGGPLTFPLRSAVAGTPVTLVPPAQTAHVSFPIEAHYYFAQ